MAPRARILEVNNVGLRVSDLERALGFYRDVLGLGVKFTSPWLDDEALLAVGGAAGGTMRVAALSVPGLVATLNLIEFAGLNSCPVRAQPHDPGTVHLSLRVQDVESWVTHMRSCGYEPVAPPRAVTGGPGEATIAFFADPDGFFIEFVQFKGGV